MEPSSRDRSFILWFRRHHEHVRGWEFEYEHPGFFVYYKGNKSIYFTPDYNRKGDIDIDLHSGGKYIPLATISYPSPLKAKFLFDAVSLYLV